MRDQRERQWVGTDGKVYDHNPLCQMPRGEQCPGVCAYCLENVIPVTPQSPRTPRP